MNTILHQGHNAEVLRQYPDCHFDAIITDPPYVEIALKRIEGWVKPKDSSHSTYNELSD
jgi:DNA modification methylase